MKLRAVIFDIYNTLLEAGPPPADAAERWTALWRQTFGQPPPLELESFAAACNRVIVREHNRARARGIAFPEVFWPAIATEALPELSQLEVTALDNFLFAHAGLQHTVRLLPDTGSVLRTLVSRDLPLGLASNCQPYTLRELNAALSAINVRREIFSDDLCFFSFAHGFSKPDPEVFHQLASALRARGLAPHETLVVGDRPDNDIEPAAAQGFQTWLLSPAVGNGQNAGTWNQLGQFLVGL